MGGFTASFWGGVIVAAIVLLPVYGAGGYAWARLLVAWRRWMRACREIKGPAKGITVTAVVLIVIAVVWVKTYLYW